MTLLKERRNSTEFKEIQSIDVVKDDWDLSQINHMTNEQIVLIIHGSFVDKVKELIKLKGNKNEILAVPFMNSVFNELLSRLNCPNLEELLKNK